MFSCHVTGVDPDLPVRFYVGNSPAAMEPVTSSSGKYIEICLSKSMLTFILTFLTLSLLKSMLKSRLTFLYPR